MSTATSRRSAAWGRVGPLPALDGDPLTRWMCHGLMAFARRRMVGVTGLEHVAPARDPFLFVCNHSQRAEAVLLPALLMAHRGGKRVHFLADWPMMLVPGVGMLYRHAGVIPVGGKSARFAVLNRLRPLYCPSTPAFERAEQVLGEGRSVAVFPEGTMNRRPDRLLRGRLGAARLALEASVPIVPAGIRFPGHRGDGPIGDSEPFSLEILPAIEPADFPDVHSSGAVRALHSRLMTALAEASGKQWSPTAARR